MTDPDLSAAGRDRRDQIERLTVRAAVRRRARRRAGRVSLGLAVVAVIAVRWRTMTVPRRPVGRPAPVLAGRLPATRHDPVSTRPPPPTTATVAITFVPTDPTIVARLRADPAGPRRWTTLGDRELLDDLAAAGRPAGLVRTADGRTVLVEP